MKRSRPPSLKDVRRAERALARRLDERVVRQLQRGLVARRPQAHLIHVNKTGGTAMKHVLTPIGRSDRYEFRLHNHMTRLPDVPPGDKFFFVVRDPIDRYVSGFNSRLRQGRPRYNVPWTAAEAVAFHQFPTPDSLGRALSSTNADERVRAYSAMVSIHNICDSYWHWFVSREYLDTRLDDLLQIAWFPDLDEAFARLADQLGLTVEARLPAGNVEAHRSPVDLDRSLSDVARLNLQRWYATDYAFIDYCAQLPCFVGPSRQVSVVGAMSTQSEFVSPDEL